MTKDDKQFVRDIDSMQALTRRLIEKLEQSVACAESEMLFSAKSPMVSSLVTLCELMLALEKARNATSAATALPSAVEPSLPMNAADLQLVQHFLQKMQQI
ncbi:MAG: hypothetical protein SFT92_02080 [Rickettsiales bacterium]|nr:hypothetical protein [Rickettsiales bacterium]